MSPVYGKVLLSQMRCCCGRLLSWGAQAPAAPCVTAWSLHVHGSSVTTYHELLLSVVRIQKLLRSWRQYALCDEQLLFECCKEHCFREANRFFSTLALTDCMPAYAPRTSKSPNAPESDTAADVPLLCGVVEVDVDAGADGCVACCSHVAAGGGCLRIHQPLRCSASACSNSSSTISSEAVVQEQRLMLLMRLGGS